MADAEKRKAPEESAEASAKTEEPPAKKAEVEPAVEKAKEEAAAKEAPAAAEAKEEPKKEAPAAKAEAAPAPAREKPAAADEPEAKRLKPTPPDPKAVRKQVEYYLSDENLRYDKFFNEKISADKDGWLDMQLVLSCNKMQAIRATKEDVIEALKESKIEVREGGTAVRRPGNAALPKLEARPTHQKKSSIHAHDGGVIAAISGIPEEQSWTQVKEKLKERLPAKVHLWFVSEVNEKNLSFVAVSPFDNDQQFFEDLSFEIGGAKLKCEVCQGDLLQQALKLIPKHVRDKRERESRKRQKERNRPILVGTQRFLNMAALRGRVKEILNSRSDGEQLKPDGSDFKLIKALLTYHPKGDEKSQGLVGMKVAKSSKGESRCFFMIKDGGVEEDFSAKKCLDAIEQNPPYVQNEPKKEAKASGSGAPAEKNPAEEKKGDEKKAEEAKPAEEKKADEAKPAEEAAKASEEKKAEEAKPAEEKKAQEAKPAEEKKAEEAKPAEENKADKAKPVEEKKAEEAKAA